MSSQNPILNALRNIRFKIPEEILDRTFLSKINSQFQFNHYSLPINLDTVIREKVIDERVCKDINLVSGKEITIQLDDNRVEKNDFDAFMTVYKIPMSMTQNRTITSVLSVGTSYNALYSNSTMSYNGSSPLLNAAKSALSSNTPIPVISYAEVSLIDVNTVLLRAIQTLPSTMSLRCIVSYDNNLTDLPARSYNLFSDLCVLATKAYIYNTLRIKMGKGEILAGQELGVFKEIVDSYQDSEELYSKKVEEEWIAASVFLDQIQMERHLRIIAGGMN